jgi:Fe2+ or Zn2+ uptake regulation protein
MKSAGKKVAPTTSHDTLGLLLESGFVSKYQFAEDRSRYEKVFGRPDRDHSIYLKCGRIAKFSVERVVQAHSDISREKNFKPQSVTSQIFGICQVRDQATERS